MGTIKLSYIRSQPTSLEADKVRAQLAEVNPCSGWHESVLRSWHIVNKVKELLNKKVPPDVILEIIEDLEQAKCP